MPVIRCPDCGEQDALRGVDSEDGKLLECGDCGHRWHRDLTPRCTLCGSEDLEAVPTSTLQEAGRGDQRTPSGIRDVYRCWSCGATDATSSSPVPGDSEEADRHTARLRRRARPPREDVAPPAAEHSGAHRVTSSFGTFEIGTVVGGRWRLTALLRRSETTSLWAAAEVDGPRRATFQLLRAGEEADADGAAHVAAARAASRIDHPNLLRIHGVQQRGADVLVAAESVPGRFLDDVPATDRLDLTSVGAAVSRALSALHARGLAHLHVRPATILVADDGRPRLVDVGIGRARATTGASRFGDPELTWLAPEQIVARDHGPPADVYSLALTLWVGAGGDLDTLGPTPSARATYRFHHDLPPLDEHVPAAEETLAAAIAAAGRRDRAARPDADELTALLTTG